MLEQLDIHSVLFIDIETVRAWKSWSEVPTRFQGHWSKKAATIVRFAGGEQDIDDEVVQRQYLERAGIYSEFAKVVCISVGFIAKQSGELRIKSFYGHDEVELLKSFSAMMVRFYPNPDVHLFCGHNIREFDVPFLCRRFAIHRLPLPALLDLSGRKPWEIRHLDTMQLWKFGDVKNFTSLDLLATVLQIETPKDDIDGSMVNGVYWDEGDLARIAQYCEKDVLTVAQVLLHLKGLEPLPVDKVVAV